MSLSPVNQEHSGFWNDKDSHSHGAPQWKPECVYIITQRKKRKKEPYQYFQKLFFITDWDMML